MSVPNTQLLRKLIIMRMKKLMMALLCLSFSGTLSAQITNPSFESGFDGWRESDPNQVITISNIANSGNRSDQPELEVMVAVYHSVLTLKRIVHIV